MKYNEPKPVDDYFVLILKNGDIESGNKIEIIHNEGAIELYHVTEIPSTGKYLGRFNLKDIELIKTPHGHIHKDWLNEN